MSATPVVMMMATIAITGCASLARPIPAKHVVEPIPPPCTDAAMVARASADSSSIVPPKPLEILLHRLEFGDDRRYTVSMRVDSIGRVDTGSVVIKGTFTRATSRTLLAGYRKMKFRPAIFSAGNCAVSARTWVAVETSQNPWPSPRPP